MNTPQSSHTHTDTHTRVRREELVIIKQLRASQLKRVQHERRWCYCLLKTNTTWLMVRMLLWWRMVMYTSPDVCVISLLVKGRFAQRAGRNNWRIRFDSSCHYTWMWVDKMLQTAGGIKHCHASVDVQEDAGRAECEMCIQHSQIPIAPVSNANPDYVVVHGLYCMNSRITNRHTYH